MPEKKEIGFIGGGRMAEAIIKGLTGHGISTLVVYDASGPRLKVLKKLYGIEAVKSNREVTGRADVIIIAVKPGDVAKVCTEIKESLSPASLVISIAAGISLAYLQGCLGSQRIVRTMPNTPALVGRGMTVIASSPSTAKKDIGRAQEIFSRIGDVLVMDEKYLDAVTAVSGSGPAFVSLFAEAMIDGAVRLGIQRDHALKLSVKTMEGTLALLESGIHTAQLRDMVTSPGGTTAEGLAVLETGGFKGVVMDALKKACERASNLAR